MELSPIRTQRTFEEISGQIHRQIRAGILRIGDRLPNERELAKTLAVSRHAVREALRALESVGLVELRKGASGGAFIARAKPDAMAEVVRGMFYVGGISIEQLTEARLWLESLLVRVACERIDDAGLRALEENVAQAETHTRAGNLSEKTRLNIDFHTLLAASTGNPLLTVLMTSMMSVLREFASQIGSVMEMSVIESRRRLIKYMRNRDAARAVEEMEKHLKILDRHYRNAAARMNGASQQKSRPRASERKRRA